MVKCHFTCLNTSVKNYVKYLDTQNHADLMNGIVTGVLLVLNTKKKLVSADGTHRDHEPRWRVGAIPY